MGQLRTGTMTTRLELGAERPGLPLGFTLVELIVVMAIIGIILAFLLAAAGDARRRAEQDATLALITKLEGGINDRLDALLQTRPDPTLGHVALANIYYSATQIVGSSPRAQVLAYYDFIKRELPDVFVVHNATGPYPLNFAANPFQADTNLTPLGQYVLPLDAGTVSLPSGSLTFSPGEGIYGASYTAAAGIYKNLGYLPTGYDGVDNDGDGLIDNWAEGVNGPPSYSTPNATVQALVQRNLAAHLHHTARSETLYAILVEGIGPLGSVFSRDDFSDREVKDTDGDGLPEFVDAWGQPLQFFRWPLLYHTDTQRGQVINYVTSAPPSPSDVELLNPPYLSVFEAREQDPLDPNQQLMAPAWWSSTQNGNQLGFTGTAALVRGSGGVLAFEYFFHRLTEPLASNGTPALYWDRGTSSFAARRAFFTKPLILSGGPDQQPGVFLYPDSPSLPPNATQLLAVENNAMPYLFDFTAAAQVPSTTSTLPSGPYISSAPGDSSYPTYQLRENGRDDISNQNRQATGGVGGS
jgi:prepilin-type N-terminal cleavage/methylation domain-containing protein